MIHHQKTTKYCLKIQGKDSADKEYKCNCGKIFIHKYHYELHNKNCIMSEILFYKEKIKDLEENLLYYKKNIKDLELIIIEKDNDISMLQGEINIYKKDHDAFVDIAKKPKNTTNTTNNNKVLNITSSIDFNDKTKIQSALENYNLEYFLDGQRGIARFVVDNILKDEENNLIYLCTDQSRSTFKYKDTYGNIQKDYEAKKLTNYLVEGGIKHKLVDITEKWIGNDNKIDKNKLEIVLEKNIELSSLY